MNSTIKYLLFLLFSLLLFSMIIIIFNNNSDNNSLLLKKNSNLYLAIDSWSTISNLNNIDNILPKLEENKEKILSFDNNLNEFKGVILKEGKNKNPENLLSVGIKKVLKNKSIKKNKSILKKKYYKWNNLITKIWKSFNVWVHSLKINDKFFLKKTWYIHLWDTIEQIWEANIRGCFNMKVLFSKISTNIWKTWYVCKKYLKDLSYKDKKIYFKKNTLKKEYIINNIISTKVWNTYEVLSKSNIQTKSFKSSFSIINVGSLVEQVTKEDNKWCFNVLILRSYWSNMDIWKIWYLCKSSLKKILYTCK